MEIGILGLAQSGKSTLFEIMTGIKSREIFGESTVKGIANVPDARFDSLVEIYKPAKVTPAKVPFVDINITGENQWNAIRQALSAVDGLLHIVDGFTTSDVPEMVKRCNKLADELILADLVIVETKLTKLGKTPKTALKGDELVQFDVLPRAKETLEAGKPLRTLSFTEQENHALKSFSFWTLRPELVVINLKEDLSLAENFKKESGTSSPVIGINCQLEAEIAELPPADRKEFMDSMGLKEAAFERIIQTAFSLLGRMYYFTAGDDEVRAWVIPTNSTAPRAASAIHKDFERGFIKAEVVAYNDFMAHGKSIAGAKAAGKLRLEGKEYIVQDGDIISFRFNV